MYHNVALLSLLALGSASAQNCTNLAWAQCGGQGWTGETCCPAGYDCTYDNDYFSGCSLEDLCLVVQYGQCGGVDTQGQPWPEAQECCPAGFECSYESQYYSQCVEAGSNSTDCSPAYGQCGGEGYDGPSCCTAGYECTADPVNPEYYSGCTLIPVCENAFYGQCGGVDSGGNPWTQDHTTCCPDGFVCEYSSQYFSQCCPPDGCDSGAAASNKVIRDHLKIATYFEEQRNKNKGN